MDRSVALLCLIGLDRSRVIACHLRDIGYVYIPVHELLNLIRKLRPDGEIMRMFRDGSRTGFLGALPRLCRLRIVSLLALVIILNCTNRMPGV